MYLCKGWIGCCARPCVLERLVVLKTNTCHMSAERQKEDQHTHVRQQKDVGMPGQFLCNETVKGGACQGHKDVSRFRGRVNMSSATAPNRVMSGHLFQAAVAGGAVAEKHVLCKGPVDRILLNGSGVMLYRLCKVLLLKGLVAVELGLQSRSQVRAGRAAFHIWSVPVVLCHHRQSSRKPRSRPKQSAQSERKMLHTIPHAKIPRHARSHSPSSRHVANFFHAATHQNTSPLSSLGPLVVSEAQPNDLKGKKWTNLQHHHRTQPDPISPGVAFFT
jgi:hypothetical protein